MHSFRIINFLAGYPVTSKIFGRISIQCNPRIIKVLKSPDFQMIKEKNSTLIIIINVILYFVDFVMHQGVKLDRIEEFM